MKPRLALAGLLVAAASLFPVGVGLERRGEGHHGADGGVSEAHGHAHEGEAPSAEIHEEEDEAEREGEEASEKVFGVRTESTGTVMGVIVVSAVLALVLWRGVAGRPAVIAALVFTAGAAFLDIGELVRQLDRHRPGVAAVAAAVAALHLAALAAGAVTLRDQPGLASRHVP